MMNTSKIIAITEQDLVLIKRIHGTCKFKAIYDKDLATQSILQICVPMEAIAMLSNFTTNDNFLKILSILNERFYSFVQYILGDANVLGQFCTAYSKRQLIERVESYVKSIGYYDIQQMLDEYIENNLVYDIMLHKHKEQFTRRDF